MHELEAEARGSLEPKSLKPAWVTQPGSHLKPKKQEQKIKTKQKLKQLSCTESLSLFKVLKTPKTMLCIAQERRHIESVGMIHNNFKTVIAFVE
jgi:hypothetical protein